MYGYNEMARCPECGYTVMLNGAAIPAHVPRGSQEHRLCDASGFMWAAAQEHIWRRAGAS